MSQEQNILIERISNLLGIADREIEIYFALLQSDSMSAGEISKNTGVHRTRIYEILRRLEQFGLIWQIRSNPIIYSALSPKIALEALISQKQRELEAEKEQFTEISDILQQLWENQHSEILGSHVSLISERLVKEILPKETSQAQKHIKLVLRSIKHRNSKDSHVHLRLFDLNRFSRDVRRLMEKNVRLQILVGASSEFLTKIPPPMFRVFISGLSKGVLEFRLSPKELHQSFVVVDSERSYLFFLGTQKYVKGEALRSEDPNLTLFLEQTFEMLWKDAQKIKLEPTAAASPEGITAFYTDESNTNTASDANQA
ncbi:MAG: TrmB family transcriptional regulator [Candidatus Heimdallarchaeota archaeon]